MRNRLYKQIPIILTISCILTIFTGCGKKEEVEESTIMAEEINVEQGNDAAFNIHDLTMEELYNMTPAQVESTILEGVPDWRRIFKVSENYIMKENDWYEMKILLGYSLWEKEWLSWYKEKEKERAKEIEKEKVGGTISENLPEDPNYIYYAPTESFIKNMSDEEYIEYLQNMYKYYGLGDIDIHELTHEQIVELKKDQLENVAVDDSTYIEIIPDEQIDDTTRETISVSNNETVEEINIEQIN